MVTINKTYEKIAPKLDDMVRRGFSDIELRYTNTANTNIEITNLNITSPMKLNHQFTLSTTCNKSCNGGLCVYLAVIPND